MDAANPQRSTAPAPPAMHPLRSIDPAPRSARSTHALLTLSALLLPACFKAPTLSAERSLSTWHDMQAADPRRGPSDRTSPAPTPGDALTPEQAYALALRRNPDLAVVEAEVTALEAGIGAARQLENPTLRLTNFQIDETVAGRPGMNLGLRAPIPRPGSLQAEAAAARYLAEGAASRAEAARRRLRTDIRRYYAQLAFFTADLQELARAAELTDQRRKQLRARVDLAVATRVDLSLVEVEHAELLDEQSRVRGELARAESALTLLIAPGTRQTFRIDTADLEPRDLELDRDALIDKAVASRQELRDSQTRTGEAEAEVYLAKNEAWPWIAWAQVNYQFRTPTGPVVNPTTPAFGFGLALDIPLFSLNLRKIKAAKAVVRQRQLEERAAVALVANEVAAALTRLEQADARVRQIETSLLPQIEDAARHAESALTAGGLDAIKALEIADRQVAARRAHLEALWERRDAALELEAALGAAP